MLIPERRLDSLSRSLRRAFELRGARIAQRHLPRRWQSQSLLLPCCRTGAVLRTTSYLLPTTCYLPPHLSPTTLLPTTHYLLPTTPTAYCLLPTATATATAAATATATATFYSYCYCQCCCPPSSSSSSCSSPPPSTTGTSTATEVKSRFSGFSGRCAPRSRTKERWRLDPFGRASGAQVSGWV